MPLCKSLSPILWQVIVFCQCWERLPPTPSLLFFQLMTLNIARNVLGTKNLGDILSERESIAKDMQVDINDHLVTILWMQLLIYTKKAQLYLLWVDPFLVVCRWPLHGSPHVWVWSTKMPIGINLRKMETIKIILGIVYSIPLILIYLN